MATKRSKAPRRLRNGAATCRFNMELQREELNAIRKAAEAANLSMSAWVRLTLRKALNE